MESFLKKKLTLYKKYSSISAVKTAVFARSFAKRLKPGDVVGLLGDLGAGKTQFIKGAAEFFGFKQKDIVSPTFNLVKEHKKTGISIYHFDLYRLEKAGELDKIGYRDYITDEKAVTFVEWPDRIKETWKDYNWVIVIRHKGGNKREINIYKSGVRSPESKTRARISISFEVESGPRTPDLQRKLFDASKRLN